MAESITTTSVGDMMSENRLVGKELVERLARFVDSLPDDVANSIQASSASTERAARKADVMPTAVFQIAQACANAICNGGVITVRTLEENEWVTYAHYRESEVAVRIAKTLHAINETQGEGTKPNA